MSRPLFARMLAAALLLRLVAPLAVAADGRELASLLAELGASCEWDPVRGAGLLLLGDDRVSFQLDVPFVIVNWLEEVAIVPPRRAEDGGVWLADTAVAAIRAAVDRHRQARASRAQRIAVILLDPGHGGADSGAVGEVLRDGTAVPLLEKDVNLQVAGLLASLLRERMSGKGIEATRYGDVQVELEERSRIANRILERTGEAVLYVSIHANKSFNRTATGFEVWYLPPTYRRTLIDEKTASLDDREILPILNSMLEEEISIESVLLARDILKGLERTIGGVSPNRGLKQEAWAVVRNSKMPAVLVEIGYLSHPGEAARLADPAYLQLIAEGLYSGVANFVERYERAGGAGGP